MTLPPVEDRRVVPVPLDGSDPARLELLEPRGPGRGQVLLVHNRQLRRDKNPNLVHRVVVPVQQLSGRLAELRKETFHQQEAEAAALTPAGGSGCGTARN